MRPIMHLHYLILYLQLIYAQLTISTCFAAIKVESTRVRRKKSFITNL